MNAKRLNETKRLHRFLLACAFVLCFGLLATTTQAYAVTYPVAINATNFPDANLRSYVAANFDTAPTDGQLDTAEASAVTAIYVSGLGVSSLEGVECFPNLQELDCSSNQLSSLDVGNNPALMYLYVFNNQLSTLDVSNNPLLTVLDCFDNQLSSLDVSNNPALTELYCDGNQLSSLDVSSNPALAGLYCPNNQLSSLDVSNNPALAGLDCARNQLSSLDVGNNPLLTQLWCYTNQLSSLDVSNSPLLTVLDCDANQLSSLDVSNNPALTELYCIVNQLSSLDVSNNPLLTQLFCDGNQLSSLDVSNNPLLEQLGCSENKLSSLDVSKNPLLRYLDCLGNQLLDVNGWLGAVDPVYNQNQTVSMSAKAVGSDSFVSGTAFAFGAGHSISFPGGEASYDPTTGLFTTTLLNTPIPFITYNGANYVASGTISFSSPLILLPPPEAPSTEVPGEGAPTELPKTGDSATVLLIIGALLALCAGIVTLRHKTAYRQKR